MYCLLFIVIHMKRSSFVLMSKCKTTHCLGLTCTMHNANNSIMYITCLGHTPGQTEAFTTYIIHIQINKEINKTIMN